MPKVTSLELINEARKNNHAVGAFNVYNIESIKSVTEASKETGIGVIIQITSSAAKYGGLKNIYDICMNQIDTTGIKAAIHLDHGPSLDMVHECLDLGFSSVMFDGSALPFSENAEKTAIAVAAAHKSGATCEGELGRLQGQEDEISVSEQDKIYTHPDEAARFVNDTHVDIFAVSIGNAHGFYKGEPHIDFERLAQIKEKVSVPLVLHGASGIPDDTIRKAITLGICKINIDTELRFAFMQGMEKYISENPGSAAARDALMVGRDYMKSKVIEKIKLFNPGK
jgi:fructose-bisphosphate aldolase, class II